MKTFLFLLLALPGILFAEGGLPNQPYIYVEGIGEVEKLADMITLRFDVVSRDIDEIKANQEVQAKATKALALLDNKKIAANDVIAQDLRSEPEYEKDEDSSSRGKLIGYKVTRTFWVKVRVFPVFPKLVDELIALGGVEFSQIDSGLSKEKEMQDEVWERALVNARERAEKTLKQIGMKIDSVFAVSPVAFTQIEGNMFGGGGRATAAELGPVPDPKQYRLAPVTVRQEVHVIYLISPVK